MPAYYIHHLVLDKTLPYHTDEDGWTPCNKIELIGPFDDASYASEIAERLYNDDRINNSWAIVGLNVSDRYIINVVSPDTYTE